MGTKGPQGLTARQPPVLCFRPLGELGSGNRGLGGLPENLHLLFSIWRLKEWIFKKWMFAPVSFERYT